MEIQSHTLKNGIRIVHQRVTNNVAHCGVFINAGTRNEREEEHGLAHFIEHVIFKGTAKRKLFHVLNRLESVGADLNAFTTKEETCIYASFLNRYYDRSLELFSDILFNSVFPEKEVEKEKDVIYEEINSYKDFPIDKIYDDFEELIFKGHPLGRNILGTKRNIRKFKKRHILTFLQEYYHTDRIVICSVGNIDFRKLVSFSEKYFDKMQSELISPPGANGSDYEPSVISVKKRTFQTHCILGNRAYDFNDNRRIPLLLLNNILGGPGLNSRMNLSIREKYGLAYNIESNYVPYSDSGIFSIYLGIDNGSNERAITYVNRELKKLREISLGTQQLRSAKQQFIGQLAIAYESNLARMLHMGKSILIRDHVESMQEIIDSIEDVSAGVLREIANEIFDPDQISMLTYLSK